MRLMLDHPAPRRAGRLPTGFTTRLRFGRLSGLLAGLLLFLSGCDGGGEQTPRPVRTEGVQQVKKLRDDNEVEFRDLRGRWLAAKGELIRLRNELTEARSAQVGLNADTDARLQRIEASIVALAGDLEAMRREMTRPPPPDDERERLAKSYEEIACLRRRGAEEAVADVYRRYGFESLEAWASAWTTAARDESFERDVTARIARLCP